MQRQGVNFINMYECTNFSYECRFGSFFSSYMYIVKAEEMTFVQKFVLEMLMKLAIGQ